MNAKQHTRRQAGAKNEVAVTVGMIEAGIDAYYKWAARDDLPEPIRLATLCDNIYLAMERRKADFCRDS